MTREIEEEQLSPTDIAEQPDLTDSLKPKVASIHPTEGREKVTSVTGWPCIWDGYLRRFIAANPEHQWLRVVGRTPDITIERINLVRGWKC